MMLFIVTVWCCLRVNYLLSCLCNWFRLITDLTGLDRFYIIRIITLQPGKIIFSIRLSILIQTETNIVLNNSLHQLVRAPHDAGLFGTIFLFHEWQNSVVLMQRLRNFKAIKVEHSSKSFRGTSHIRKKATDIQLPLCSTISCLTVCPHKLVIVSQFLFSISDGMAHGLEVASPKLDQRIAMRRYTISFAIPVFGIYNEMSMPPSQM